MRPSSTLHGYAIFISRSRLRRITEYPTGDGKAVKKFYKGILIVGGGINSAETAKKISEAGADIIVIGTMIEREKDGNQNLLIL